MNPNDEVSRRKFLAASGGGYLGMDFPAGIGVFQEELGHRLLFAFYNFGSRRNFE